MNKYIEEICQLFYEMYQPHQYELTGSYENENGKYICIFRSKRKNRYIHVYKSDKGYLKPFFPNTTN